MFPVHGGLGRQGSSWSIFAWFHLVRGWTRPASFYELVVLAQAATCSQLVLLYFQPRNGYDAADTQ